MHLSIDMTVEHDAWTDHARDVDAVAERAVDAVLTEAARMAPPLAVAETSELSILLTGDARIRKLNRQWRGKDAATNVLSFPAAGPARAMTLGDIVVAYETSAREAAERGTPLADHLTHLLIHGVLHLLGYDHETDGDAEAMEALESRTLASLGIASPYESVFEPLGGAS